jgi:hypothetical protein
MQIINTMKLISVMKMRKKNKPQRTLYGYTANKTYFYEAAVLPESAFEAFNDVITGKWGAKEEYEAAKEIIDRNTKGES